MEQKRSLRLAASVHLGLQKAAVQRAALREVWTRRALGPWRGRLSDRPRGGAGPALERAAAEEALPTLTAPLALTTKPVIPPGRAVLGTLTAGAGCESPLAFNARRCGGHGDPRRPTAGQEDMPRVTAATRTWPPAWPGLPPDVCCSSVSKAASTRNMHVHTYNTHAHTCNTCAHMQHTSAHATRNTQCTCNTHARTTYTCTRHIQHRDTAHT